jgi:hypothetical protein
MAFISLWLFIVNMALFCGCIHPPPKAVGHENCGSVVDSFLLLGRHFASLNEIKKIFVGE